MSDYLINLANQPATRNLVKSLGLPTPRRLTRADGGYADQPLDGRTVLFGAAPRGYAGKALKATLKQAGAELLETATSLVDGQKLYALVFDATGLASAEDMGALYTFFHELMPRIASGGRVVIVSGEPTRATSSAQAAAWRGVEGFLRSLAKELGKRAANANLLYVSDDATDRLQAPLRFFLSAHCVYVDGQPLHVDAAVRAPQTLPLTQVLKDKVVLVTGAARGIGAATAARMAAEGAQVVGLDIPADEATLTATLAPLGGTALPLDITAADAPATISQFLRERFGGVDVVVHNAGVTRDKTLAKMPEHFWNMVLQINLAAILRIDAQLHADGTLRDFGRIVCLSSIGGIAGNVGQTNYGATKAALIGYVAAESPKLAARGIGINAVAPGFIETRMTAAMPFMIREAGRRMNALSQGGQPQDVAEAIMFLASPGAIGISGQVLRVCGQSLFGA